MNITLISVDDEIFCISIRTISAYLRYAGHNVNLLFLPSSTNGSHPREKFRVEYSPSLLQEVLDHCVHSDIVGISLLSNYLFRATKVTEYLKKHDFNAPIVWGGVHPTADPEGCLKFADVVCVGEGEEALLELVSHMENGRSYLETKNMWFNWNQEIIRNPLRPLLQELDSIPLPDYSCTDHWIAVQDLLEPLTRDRVMDYEGERFSVKKNGFYYPIITSRGCPHACTYCYNYVYKQLYPQQKHVRRRSVGNVIKELKMVSNAIEEPMAILMVDDNFTSRSADELRQFCSEYKREINKPFFCHCDPLNITEEKMDILIDGGCAKIAMGVETASERIATMYHREIFHRRLPKAISIIEKYRAQMLLPPSYQFIIDNPYESLEETIQTFRLALSLKRPWDNPFYSLMLFPGTFLYKKALNDGLVDHEATEIYGKDWLEFGTPFRNLWVRLYRANFSRGVLRIFLIPIVAKILSSKLSNRIWNLRLFVWLWKK